MAWDKEKRAAYNKQWHAKNKEEANAQSRQWAKDNPDKVKALSKRYRVKNKEKIAAANKKWNAENKEKKAAIEKKWYNNNKERSAANNKKWHAKNPAYHKKQSRAGNADKFGITLEDALAKQDGRCLICLKSEPTSKTGNLLAWAMDHDHQCCPSGKGCPSCFRGVICSSCNRVLGYAYDDPGILRRGAEYLAAWDIRKEGPAEGPSNLE